MIHSFFKRTGLLLFSLVIFSCSNEAKTEKEINKIDIQLQLFRFDKEFAEASPDDLPALKAKFPYLFPAQYDDDVWLQKMNDTLQHEIEQEVFKIHDDFTENFDRLYQFFQRLAYYFPSYPIPKVITLAEEVDYRNKVILDDKNLFISLDNYLGSEHHFYSGIYQYIGKLQDEAYMLTDVSDAFVSKLMQPSKDREFVYIMIDYGKRLYLNDKLLSFEPEHVRANYDAEELEWAYANEEQIWQYFVEKNLLFSTDPSLRNRFINLAPYSKFYLELDAESPPRLGQFIGWQIVRAYMKNNPNLSLQELINTKSELIFKESNYKPKR